MRARSLSSVLALVPFALGCAGSIEDPEPFLAARADGATGDASQSPSPPPPPPPGGCPDGFSVERQIFATRCATSTCHDALSAVAGLDLESPAVGSRLRNHASDACAGRVWADPSDPDGSLMVSKLRASPSCGDIMPPAPVAPLTDTEIACVRAWVQAL